MNNLISRKYGDFVHRLAVMLVITLLLMLGVNYPLTAREGGRDTVSLTLEEVKEQAVSQNIDLELLRLSLAKGELSLELLEQSRQGLQAERDKLLSFMQQLQPGALGRPADGGEAGSELTGEQPPAAADQEELISILQVSLEQMNLSLQQLESQEQQTRQGLEEGENMLQLQEEMVLFKAESLFVAGLILKRQLQLQEKVTGQLHSLQEAEQLKEGAGYSSPLQVEEAGAKLREAEAAAGTLEHTLAETVDELLICCGLTPGTAVTLKPFTPQSPVQVSMEKAISTALSSGWLVQGKRVRLDRRREELGDIESMYGKDSPQYRLAEIDLRQASLELQQSQQQTRAAVRRTCLSLNEQEQLIRKAEQDLKLGSLRQETLSAQHRCGYITVAEASAGSLARQQAETELFSARYRYHLAYREFELARQGYIMTAAPAK